MSVYTHYVIEIYLDLVLKEQFNPKYGKFSRPDAIGKIFRWSLEVYKTFSGASQQNSVAANSLKLLNVLNVKEDRNIRNTSSAQIYQERRDLHPEIFTDAAKLNALATTSSGCTSLTAHQECK